MAIINIQNETNINAKGVRTCGVNKPVICIETGEIFASVTDAAEHFGTSIYNLSNAARGVQKTARGKRFCFVSRATENLEALTNQISKLNADAEDARRWREYQAEQERIRREEEERIRAEQERIAAIERERQQREERRRKAEEKMERRQRIVERLEAELRTARERYTEAENEWNAACAETNWNNIINNEEEVA
jgi:predicted RNase H-like nuclease (RuvC/YqgF family)